MWFLNAYFIFNCSMTNWIHILAKSLIIVPQMLHGRFFQRWFKRLEWINLLFECRINYKFNKIYTLMTISKIIDNWVHIIINWGNFSPLLCRLFILKYITSECSQLNFQSYYLNYFQNSVFRKFENLQCYTRF